MSDTIEIDLVRTAAVDEIYSIEDAALILWRWACQEGLMEHAPDGAHADGSLLTNVTETGRGILRTKGILHIGTNAAVGIISVFLRRASPVAKQLAALPKAVCGFPIRYRQGVSIDVAPLDASSHNAPAWQARVSQGLMRYTCGSSISPANFRDAGTLGALVQDSSGNVFGLTNNHVSGACNHSAVGLPILAPGVADVVANGLDPFTIGHHYRSLTITPGDVTVVNPKENLDAAIFRIVDLSKVSSFQGAIYDTPTITTQLAAGMQVEKVGRTTGHTTGTVTERICGPFKIRYAAQIYGFTGEVFFDPLFVISGSGDLFSTNGDSGSLIVTQLPDGQKAAVGIVVGGMSAPWAPGGAISLALPIEPVLTRLQVSLVGSHNI